MILQLNPTIPVIVTSKDNAKGYAILVTDYSQEHHLYWTVALDNGEIWTVPNTEIRLQDNWTMGRREGLKAYEGPECSTGPISFGSDPLELAGLVKVKEAIHETLCPDKFKVMQPVEHRNGLNLPACKQCGKVLGLDNLMKQFPFCNKDCFEVCAKADLEKSK